MIDPDPVVERKRPGESGDPPVEPRRFVPLPRVDGISPSLPVSAEVIRRDAGDANGTEIAVEIEKFRPAPYLRAVSHDVDRKIAEQRHSGARASSAQAFPLFVEAPLFEDREIDLRGLSAAKCVQRRRVPEPQRFRPLPPGESPERALDGAKERVVLDPVRVFPSEARRLVPETGRHADECIAENAVFFGGGRLVANRAHREAGRNARVFRPEVRRLFEEQLRTYQKGISGEGRGRTVRRMPEPSVRLGDREHLPGALTRPLEKGEKRIGACAHVADSPGRGERKDRQQNTARTTHAESSRTNPIFSSGARPSTRWKHSRTASPLSSRGAALGTPRIDALSGKTIAARLSGLYNAAIA